MLSLLFSRDWDHLRHRRVDPPRSTCETLGHPHGHQDPPQVVHQSTPILAEHVDSAGAGWALNSIIKPHFVSFGNPFSYSHKRFPRGSPWPPSPCNPPRARTRLGRPPLTTTRSCRPTRSWPSLPSSP